MKSLSLVLLCVLAHLVHCNNPISKVMQMLTDMQQRIIRQGSDFQKSYEKFSDWCAERSRELHQEIKVAKSQIANLEGNIEKESDHIVSLDTKIGDLSAQLSTDESDLKAIVLIRKKEMKEFEKAQHEMSDMINALQHAITIIEREMRGGTSLAQMSRAGDIAKVFAAMVEANSLNTADAQTLTALVQSGTDSDQGDTQGSEESEEEDEDALGAPASGAAYESKSAGIVETLENLLDKAQAELDEERSAETTRQNNFDLLRQVLETRIKAATKEMDMAKKSKAEAGESKATAEGDLSVTKNDVAQDIKTLSGLHHKCMAKAQDFQQETKTRGEELNALTKAKDVIRELSKQEDSSLQTDDEESSPALVQVRMRTRSKHRGGEPTGLQIVHMLKKTAKSIHSIVLAQFAVNLDSTIRTSNFAGDDPFAKVKQMITDMITTLEKKANDEADHKVYCDKELAFSRAKEEQKLDDSEGLTTKVDRMNAEAAQLSGQLAMLHKEIGEIARSQSEMDSNRQDEKDNVKKCKPELENGIKAVQLASEVLRDYYAKGDHKEQAEESGSGNIIGMLEVVESDFSRTLAEMLSEEEAAEAAYLESTKENELAKAAKEQDVKFKTTRSKTLAKSSSELGSDRDGIGNELSAVDEYIARIQAECIAKPEPYEERKKRREEELAGLKGALEVLRGGVSLLQESSGRRLLRGVRVHALA